MTLFIITIIFCYLFIYLFKFAGMEQTPGGLLAGFSSSFVVHLVFFFLGADPKYIILSFVMFTTLAVVFGFLVSRQIYSDKG